MTAQVYNLNNQMGSVVTIVPTTVVDTVTIVESVQGQQGIQGQTGATPQIAVSATSLPSTDSATATISGTAENPNIAFGIPQGIQGIQGVQGIQGIQGEQGIQGPPFQLNILSISTGGSLNAGESISIPFTSNATALSTPVIGTSLLHVFCSIAQYNGEYILKIYNNSNSVLPLTTVTIGEISL